MISIVYLGIIRYFTEIFFFYLSSHWWMGLALLTVNVLSAHQYCCQNLTPTHSLEERGVDRQGMGEGVGWVRIKLDIFWRNLCSRYFHYFHTNICKFLVLFFLIVWQPSKFFWVNPPNLFGPSLQNALANPPKCFGEPQKVCGYPPKYFGDFEYQGNVTQQQLYLTM